MKTGGKYNGIMTALITPLKEDRCTVDTEALAKLIEFQLAHKVNSFLILGGSGEYCALSQEQRMAAVETCVKTVNGRVPIMAGVLETGLGECLKVCKDFIAAGVDSLLILTPYYVHATQEGLYQYFKAVEAALQFPFAVYNIPYRTMVNCEPATIERLAEDCPHMIGMKECSPNFQQAQEVINRAAAKCDILSGEENLMAAEVACGAEGGIMATANLLPDLFVELYALGKAGKVQEASARLHEYLPLIKLLFKETNPGPMKYAMSLAGMNVGGVALPLIDPGDELKAAIKAEMQRMGVIA